MPPPSERGVKQQPEIAILNEMSMDVDSIAQVTGGTIHAWKRPGSSDFEPYKIEFLLIDATLDLRGGRAALEFPSQDPKPKRGRRRATQGNPREYMLLDAVIVDEANQSVTFIQADRVGEGISNLIKAEVKKDQPLRVYSAANDNDPLRRTFSQLDAEIMLAIFRSELPDEE